MRKWSEPKVPALFLLLFVLPAVTAAADTGIIYKQECADCHGDSRLGGQGPALLPENLKRLTREEAAEVIRSGRSATQMPAYGHRLDKSTIASLVEFIYQPLDFVPTWDERRITDSHRILRAANPDISRPEYTADPLNLFVVVETGDHHITILDGDRFEPVHRFRTRVALHGGPKFSPDGRYVYLASRDGWIAKYDLYALEYVAEIRAGINTRNLAVSSDGRFVLVGNYLPHSLAVLDAADLQLIKLIPVTDGTGNSSRVSAVYDAPPRQSFIVALKDLTEVWEIPYAENAEPVYSGLVHDYRYDEALAEEGPFPVRRIRLDDYLDDFFFDTDYNNVIGAARNSRNGQVVSLLVGKKIADIDLSGLPHLGSGISWEYGGRTVLASPNLRESRVSIIDTGTWEVIKRIETRGPGFFMRTHENSPYCWVDVFFGPDRDLVHVIDKQTLEIVKTLQPEPGKISAHVEFTRDGRYALLSIWDEDGTIIVYDSHTLEEIKRLPMNKPSGKYNVYNKINLSRGTSH
jgi:DNA-binding beta-propeller fold protein YncE